MRTDAKDVRCQRALDAVTRARTELHEAWRQWSNSIDSHDTTTQCHVDAVRALDDLERALVADMRAILWERVDQMPGR